MSSSATDLPLSMRSLGPWLKLLWNLAPTLVQVPVADEDSAPAPWLSPAGLHLPVPPGLATDETAEWLRAAAAHAAAHLVFSRSVFQRDGVAAVTWALTGVLEDARAEALAARELPGLARLWATQHRATPQSGDDFEGLLARLARALADAQYVDSHPWVCKCRALFWRDRDQQVLAVPDARRLRTLASEMGHDIGQMRMPLNLRTYRPQPDYRDDNRWLWHADTQTAAAPQPVPAPAAPTVRQAVAPPSTSQLHWRYPEWDRRAARLRRDWCSVSESVASAGEGPRLADWPAPATSLVQVLARAARDSRVWQSSALAGDELDLREAVQSRLQLRAGLPDGNARPYRRVRSVPRRVAALLMVDASASSAEPATEDGATALERQCAQAAVLAQAMQRAGWRVSIRAFRSDGRHRVQVARVLDFGAPWDALAASRLAGLRGEKSTRLGAVLRHATHLLAAQPAQQRWAIMLGDGEPHDIDMHDDADLAHDARAALRSARQRGVQSACLQPGTHDSAIARAVFGPARSGCAGQAGADWTRTLGRLLQG